MVSESPTGLRIAHCPTHKFDDSPGARGFVESSYINGLSPQELFFQLWVDVLVLLIQLLKHQLLLYSASTYQGYGGPDGIHDMTVRTNKGKVVQFTYRR